MYQTSENPHIYEANCTILAELNETDFQKNDSIPHSQKCMEHSDRRLISKLNNITHLPNKQIHTFLPPKAKWAFFSGTQKAVQNRSCQDTKQVLNLRILKS